MIWTLLKLGLLMLSYLGYWEFFRRKLKIDVYFTPAFTFAVHFMVMFIPGLLNFLGETVILLYLLGFAVLIDSLRKEGLRFLKYYINPGIIVFLAMFGIIAMAIRGAKLEGIDNFTHWGSIVKNMLLTNQFPTFAQDTLWFSHSPIGSSALIYYFCRFVGSEEDIQMMAQALVMLSLFLPVFAFAKRKWVLSTLFAVGMLNYLLAYNIYVTDLLVDTILPMAGAASLLFWYSECVEKQENEQFGRFCIYREYLIFPLLFLTMSIKTSGLLFVALVLILAMMNVHKRSKAWKPILSVVLFLVIGYLLWKRHCAYVLPNADTAPHAASLTHFDRIFGEKSLEDLWFIIKNAFKAMLIRKELFWMIGVIAALGIATMLLKKGKIGKYKQLILCLGVFYFVFWLGLVGMYIFSMEKDAALALASFDRYIKQADVFVYIVITAWAVTLLSEVRQTKNAICAGVLILLIVLGAWKDTAGMITVFQMKKNVQARDRVESVLEAYGVPGGWTYLLCDKEEKENYATWTARYYLNSPNVKCIDVTEIEQLEQEKGYQYIVVLDEENPFVQEFINQNYPEQAGERVIRNFG